MRIIPAPVEGKPSKKTPKGYKKWKGRTNATNDDDQPLLSGNGEPHPTKIKQKNNIVVYHINAFKYVVKEMPNPESAEVKDPESASSRYHHFT